MDSAGCVAGGMLGAGMVVVAMSCGKGEGRDSVVDMRNLPLHHRCHDFFRL